MKIKKIISLLAAMILVAALLLLSGCQGFGGEETKYNIYYLNQERNAIVSKGFFPVTEENDTEAMIDEFLLQLESGTTDVEYQKVYPEDVELERTLYSNGIVQLYFNSDYSLMPVNQEVLCRGAIVQTLMQIPKVTGVEFYVDGMPLRDANQKGVGVMTNDSFVSNPGEKINNIQTADLTLYFASLDGESLVSETQHVHYYSSNISTEKLIMEQLLEGPVSENAQAAIPEGTGLISVSVMDGVCVVNLDGSFMAQNYNIREDVVIYSIVNSLTELSNVDMVQISVNGETNMVYRQDLSLNDYYTANDGLVREVGEDVEVDQQEQQEKDKEGLIDTGQ